ncbi:MAG: c-type cytochrome, partial [Chitinophagaceae bacterium]|nr:c-type cytochrome [Chitinophagaceae bacterium]
NTARHRAVELAKDEHLPQDQRAIAIDFLSLQNPQPYAAWLKALVTPKEPLQVQLAALNALKVIPGTEISKYLLNNWQTLPPGVITAAVNTLMTSEDRINLLLEAIEKKQISLSDIDWVQSVRLRSSANMKIRAWARELFSRKEAGLKNLLQEYQAALSLKGNAERGKQIFQQNCAVCHQIEGKLGRAFGPDLGTVHAWAQADIMTNILDPNQSIAHGYDTWEITANNGESVQGVVSSESPTSITVNDANGQSRSISRLDIQSMKALNISAMPAGWEDKITKQQMADLITFLKFGE